MTQPTAKPPAHSLTVPLDGFTIAIARSCLKGRAIVTVLQNGRTVAVAKANRDQLAALIDAASARRVAMAPRTTP